MFLLPQPTQLLPRLPAQAELENCTFGSHPMGWNPIHCLEREAKINSDLSLLFTNSFRELKHSTGPKNDIYSTNICQEPTVCKALCWALIIQFSWNERAWVNDRWLSCTLPSYFFICRQRALPGMSELKHSHKAILCPKVNPFWANDDLAQFFSLSPCSEELGVPRSRWNSL